MNARRTAAAATTASAATVPIRPPDRRPHAIASTYDHDGVLVRRLDLRIARRARLLHATVTVAAQATTATRHVVLVVGRCTGGELGFPTCPPALRLPITLPAGAATTDVSRTITLHQPPPWTDNVQAALVTPAAARHTRFGSNEEYANLLLRGTAWRAPLAGQTFGVATPARRPAPTTPTTTRWSPPAARPSTAPRSIAPPAPPPCR